MTGGIDVTGATATQRDETSDDYGAVYDRHYARIVRLATLLLRDRSEAEDVTQEVFLAMHQERRRRAEATHALLPMKWGAWLTRVTVNACHRRRRSRWWQWWSHAAEEFRCEDLVGRDALPEATSIMRDEGERMLGVFSTLSHRQREIFVLRHVEGYSTAEVAGLLEIDAGTVKRHLFRAVHAFRKNLGGRS